MHSWSGIADGRFTDKEIVSRLDTDENSIKYKENIKTTHCVIIDEIPMISMKLFDQTEFICSKIWDNSIVFGGMPL